MDSSPQTTESLIAVGSKIDNESSGLMPTYNQCYLLYFIMGTYFAPDLKGEGPQKSVLQRQAEGLPPYTSDQLAGSHIKTIEVERVYYYVLRKADQSVIVKLPWLRQFFHGNLPTPAQDPGVAYPQFDDLFPSHLHTQSRYNNRYDVIENIVFLNNPETLYIKPEDIERFKRLTGLEDFILDRDSATLHTYVESEGLYNVAVQEVKFNGELPPPRSSHASQGERYLNDLPKPNDLQIVHVEKLGSSFPYNVTPLFSTVPPISTPPLSTAPHNGTPSVSGVAYNGTPLTFSYAAPLQTDVDPEKFGPAMIFLPSRPTKEEWSNIVAATKSGSALTGSAAMGQIGPVLGLMDIGECKDSYLFRVSLPGVKRDEREFSCEVENDGKVLIRGVTATGEKTVHRYSQVFEMQSQNLCPPGHFSISFKLPGPVDPQQFSGNFGTDGILEGIVMKEGPKNN